MRSSPKNPCSHTRSSSAWPAEHPARRRGQLAQQPELGQRQRHLLVAAVHRAARLAEHQRRAGIAVEDDLVRARPRSPLARARRRRARSRAVISLTSNGLVT